MLRSRIVFDFFLSPRCEWEQGLGREEWELSDVWFIRLLTCFYGGETAVNQVGARMQDLQKKLGDRVTFLKPLTTNLELHLYSPSTSYKKVTHTRLRVG